MGNSCFVQGVRMGLSVFIRPVVIMFASAILAAACAATPNKPGDSGKSVQPAASAPTAAAEFYPSTYHAPASPPTLIRHATVLTGTGTRLDDADVLIVD